MAAVLKERWSDALLFRDLATLRIDANVFETVDDLRWRGPKPEFADLCRRLGAPEVAEAADRLPHT